MMEDIEPPKVKGVAVAIVPEINEENEQEWSVYLINFQDKQIEGVLVSSEGYGQIKGEHKKTSLLRHFLDEIEPNTFKKIESIIPDVFAMTNQYWVSYYADKVLHDKKYIFVSGSIDSLNFSQIPLLNTEGVMIK
jgi:hypothetical protein